MARLKRGLVHIYTGDGKGKTTAALGLTLRALAAGLRVCAFAFLKNGAFSPKEPGILKSLGRNFKFRRFDEEHPIFWNVKDKSDKINRIKRLRSALRKDMSEACAALVSKKYDMVILDEIINAVSSGLLDEKELISLIEAKPASVELVLTGRGATKVLIEKADYVTEMKELKHPYSLGINARRGIEF